ncbi:methionine--tRNA ligase [Candidatus Pacearchaeota archaeon CG10_big_fil_rev_8_21_14_0_10_31_24]|nr:MAG: methionine--tRNA ligase [Candidatus Pacearchaeota archaeon CG10_big_fil_rev_8_21_14_0_10_31_24]
MKKQTFYVTTPIYYPNDIPHLGHAYTTIAADVIARWNKILEKEVFFLTGTDDHGKKISKAAEKAGKTPKDFTDSLIPEFKKAWTSLNIEYDRFIRTTDKDHEKIVQEIILKCHKNGDIYKGTYEGLYCTDCEGYYTEKDASDKNCPIHKRPLEKLKEETYFFKLSKYEKFLLDLYIKNPEFISPKNRKQEIINRVKEGLKDFSISRTSFNWGVPFPLDKKHFTYVWFDALINYYSATQNKKEKFWPADVHIIGKDILWFHSVYWPAMLKSAGIEIPKKVFAHGWWTVHNQKMGKSAGNAVKIDSMIKCAGVDSARYFLLRECSFGDDGDFSEAMLIERHNNELANKLGNLVSRVSTLAEKYTIEFTKSKNFDSKETIKKVTTHFENLELDKALNEIFAFIDKTNEYAQSKKPWETQDKKVIYELSNAIKDSAILLSPFIPETSDKIAKTFNFEISLKTLTSPLKVSKIKKSEILFKKIEQSSETKKEKHIDSKQKLNKSEKIEGVMTLNQIKYDDFAKLDLRVGTIKKAENIEGADKLLKLEVEIGSEKRTILAGIKKYYEKSDLIDKQIIVIVNLEPRKMKGLESQGMLLAAGNKEDDTCVLISPERKVDSGLKIS